MENATLLIELSRELLPYMIPSVVLGIVLGVLGIVGNALVLYNYIRYRYTTSHLFIITLGFYDMAVCLTSPLELYESFNYYSHNNVALCKIFRTTFNMSIIGSVLTLVLIAVDRYMKICHPFSQHMTNRQAMILCSLTAVVATVYNIAPAILLYGISRPETRIDGLRGYRCMTEEETFGSTLDKAFRFSLSMIFSIVLLVLTALYGLMWRELKQHSERMSNRYVTLNVLDKLQSGISRHEGSSNISQFEKESKPAMIVPDLQSATYFSGWSAENPEPDSKPDVEYQPQSVGESQPGCLKPEDEFKPQLDPGRSPEPEFEPQLEPVSKPEPVNESESEHVHKSSRNLFRSQSGKVLETVVSSISLRLQPSPVATYFDVGSSCSTTSAGSAAVSCVSGNAEALPTPELLKQSAETGQQPAEPNTSLNHDTCSATSAGSATMLSASRKAAAPHIPELLEKRAKTGQQPAGPKSSMQENTRLAPPAKTSVDGEEPDQVTKSEFARSPHQSVLSPPTIERIDSRKPCSLSATSAGKWTDRSSADLVIPIDKRYTVQRLVHSPRAQQLKRQEKRTTRSMFAVTVIFVICFLFPVFAMAIRSNKYSTYRIGLEVFMIKLGSIQSSVDPMVYAFYHQQFRNLAQNQCRRAIAIFSCYRSNDHD